MYFLASTYVNLFVVFVIIPVRIASGSFNTDPANLNNIICKIEILMFYVTRSLSCWLIVLACADRYVISSPNELWRRRFSSPKTAIRAIVITTVIIFLAFCHIPIYFNISTTNTVGQVVSTCVAQVGIYRTFINLWQGFVYSLIPSFVMLVFGLFTLINIRRQRRRVGQMIVANKSSQQRTDSQLLRMLTVQVLIILITTVPSPLFLIYLSLTSTVVKSSMRVAQEKAVNQILGGVLFIAHASSFYLYTLTGSVFRKEVVKIVPQCLRLDLRRREGQPVRIAAIEQHEMVDTAVVHRVVPIADQVRVETV
jgi:hypothetical protein